MRKLKKGISNRIKAIIEHTEGKKVLHVGCVGHSIGGMKRQMKERRWLHEYIIKHAKRVMGIDIDEGAIRELQSEGYNVKAVNAEEMQLNDAFDVILAANVVDHLSNPGLFLERCKEHLRPDGTLIVTTKNCFSWTLFGTSIFNERVVDKDNVAMYDAVALKNLARRHGFSLKEVKYILSDQKSLAWFLHKLGLRTGSFHLLMTFRPRR